MKNPNYTAWAIGLLVVIGAVSLFSDSTSSSPEQEALTVPISQPSTFQAQSFQQPAETKTKPVQQCHPSYSGCLRPDASDYDCAGGSGNGPYYTGTVRVIGPDVFGLDRDGDGWGCE